MRSYGIGIATAANWLSNFIVSISFLSLIHECSPSGAFAVYATIAIVGFVYLFYHLPETKGVRLEDIETLFDSKVDQSRIKYQPFHNSC